MRYFERSLIPLTILLVAATAYVGATVHAGAEAWQPDFAEQPRATADLEVTPQPAVASAVTAPSTQDTVLGGSRPAWSPTAPQRTRTGPIVVPPQAPREREIVRVRHSQPPRRIEGRTTAAAPLAPVRPDTEPTSIQRPSLVPTFVVRIGGLRTEQHAADVAARLARLGYHTSIASRTSDEVARYVVVSELLRHEIAEQRARMQATAGATPILRARADDRVQIVYGLYSSPQEADAAAQRIRRQGTTALVVVEGGTTYVISVGPHAKPRIDEVVASLSGARYEIEVDRAP